MADGTISVINNSKTVTGNNTTFTDDVKASDFILFSIEGTTYTYPVASIESDLSLTLIDSFNGPTTSGISYNVIPQTEMVSIPIQLIYETTLAIRGQNLDKQNWEQVYSSQDQITVTLPDGSTFTGPSWLEVSRGIDATNLDAANAIADRMEAAEDAVQASADAAATSESNSASNADQAEASATAAANSASSSATSETNAASSATEAANSAAGITDQLERATEQADRAETEADKLGNTNDFAAILDTIDIEDGE